MKFKIFALLLIILIMIKCGTQDTRTLADSGIELLVYNKDHWMDSLTEKQLSEKDSLFLLKYNARYQYGDIIEVRSMGYWGAAPKHGFNKSAFVVLKVSDIIFKDATHYTDSKYDTIGSKIITTKRRKYKTSLNLSTALSGEITVSDLTSALIGSK